MKTIWKYALPPSSAATLEIPERAEVLHVGMQQGELTLWALVDTEAPPEQRHFYVADTGESITQLAERGAYLGTVFGEAGVWVGHAFEIGPVEGVDPVDEVVDGDVSQGDRTITAEMTADEAASIGILGYAVLLGHKPPPEPLATDAKRGLRKLAEAVR